MGGQKVCLGGYMPPIPPPGTATGDKPNATTFIKPQLEFLIIKLCNFESVGGATAPPCPPVATPLMRTYRTSRIHCTRTSSNGQRIISHKMRDTIPAAKHSLPLNSTSDNLPSVIRITSTRI